MSTSILDLILNIIAGVILLTLGFFSNKLVNFIRIRPLCKFWRPFFDREVSIVLPTIPTGYTELPLVRGAGDALSSGEIQSLITSISKKSVLKNYQSRHFPADKLKENFILIGGPVTNKTTKKVMNKLKLPFAFRGDYKPEYGECGEKVVKRIHQPREKCHKIITLIIFWGLFFGLFIRAFRNVSLKACLSSMARTFENNRFFRIIPIIYIFGLALLFPENIRIGKEIVGINVHLIGFAFGFFVSYFFVREEFMKKK